MRAVAFFSHHGWGFLRMSECRPIVLQCIIVPLGFSVQSPCAHARHRACRIFMRSWWSGSARVARQYRITDSAAMFMIFPKHLDPMLSSVMRLVPGTGFTSPLSLGTAESCHECWLCAGLGLAHVCSHVPGSWCSLYVLGLGRLTSPRCPRPLPRAFKCPCLRLTSRRLPVAPEMPRPSLAIFCTVVPGERIVSHMLGAPMMSPIVGPIGS